MGLRQTAILCLDAERRRESNDVYWFDNNVVFLYRLHIIYLCNMNTVRKFHIGNGRSYSEWVLSGHF